VVDVVFKTDSIGAVWFGCVNALCSEDFDNPNFSAALCIDDFIHLIYNLYCMDYLNQCCIIFF
jgi:hypothetical protein